jgi:DNA-binding beta-propeller fold protein YncE
LKARKVVAHIPAPRGTEGLAVSPDGRRLAVAEHFATALLLIDTRTDQVLERVPLQGYPLSRPNLNHQIRVRYSPDGRHILASYYPSALVSVIDARDLHRQTLLAVTKGPMGFAFAADGRSVLVASQDWGTISVLDLSGQPHYVGDVDSAGGCETLAFY